MHATPKPIDTKALKALADESRLRIALALRKRELCVCQIIELLGLAPSTISKHLQGLKEAGIVSSTKRGTWVYYRSSFENASGISREAIKLILSDVSLSKQAEEDERTLSRILELDPEKLCERQRKC